MFGRFRAGSVSKQSKTSSKVSASSRTGRSTLGSSVDTEARLHRRWVFLTYSQCSLESKIEFEEGFSDMLQRNELTMATYYGCRENHETEGIHYHVLLNFGEQPNWSSKYTRSILPVEGNECDSLHISTPRPKQRISQYIETRVNYCEKEKGGDCFGQRPEFSLKKKLERKRKWEEIGSKPTAPAKLAKLKEQFPDVFLQIVSITRKMDDVE